MRLHSVNGLQEKDAWSSKVRRQTGKDAELGKNSKAGTHAVSVLARTSGRKMKGMENSTEEVKARLWEEDVPNMISWFTWQLASATASDGIRQCKTPDTRMNRALFLSRHCSAMWKQPYSFTKNPEDTVPSQTSLLGGRSDSSQFNAVSPTFRCFGRWDIQKLDGLGAVKKRWQREGKTLTSIVIQLVKQESSRLSIGRREIRQQWCTCRKSLNCLA